MQMVIIPSCSNGSDIQHWGEMYEDQPCTNELERGMGTSPGCGPGEGQATHPMVPGA